MRQVTTCIIYETTYARVVLRERLWNYTYKTHTRGIVHYRFKSVEIDNSKINNFMTVELVMRDL